MEDALVLRHKYCNMRIQSYVLILVLMEDALVPPRSSQHYLKQQVLILVLMEDALVLHNNEHQEAHSITS